MNDTLSRIVDRSRGTAAVVRPRVPTRFEAAAPAPEIEASAQSDARVVPAATPSPVDVRAASAPPTAPLVTESAPAPVAESQPARRNPEPPPRIVRVREVERETRIETRVESTETQVRVPRGPAPPDATRVEIHGTPTATPAREVQRLVHVLRPAAQESAPADAAREQPPREPGATPVRVEATDVRPAQADAAPERAVTQRAPAQEPAEAPVIRVTIGRIDVRAVPEPAPPRREPRESKKRLELDEYLRRRRGDR